MTGEPRVAVASYPGGIRVRSAWGGSGDGPAVFALSEAGGTLVEHGPLVSPTYERLCRAELRVETPGGPWAVRLASPIFDEPIGVPVGRAGPAGRRLRLPHLRASPPGPASCAGAIARIRRSSRILGSSRIPHVIVQAEIETFAIEAGRRGRLADRPFRRRDRGGPRRRPARPDQLRRPAQRARPADGPADRLTSAAGGGPIGGRPGGSERLWITPIDPAFGRRLWLAPARRGRASANGRDDIKTHAPGRFLRAFPCPAGIIPGRGTPSSCSSSASRSLAAGAVYLRSFGPGQRVGRLLASTPRISVEQAVALSTETGPALCPGRRPARQRRGLPRRARPAPDLPPSAARGLARPALADPQRGARPRAVPGERRPGLDRDRRRGPRRRPGRPAARGGRRGRRGTGPASRRASTRRPGSACGSSRSRRSSTRRSSARRPSIAPASRS